MDAQYQEKLVEQFVNVTGTTIERARFFLECAGWNSDLAIENFFDNHQEDEVTVESDSDDEEGFTIDPPVPVVSQAPPTLASSKPAARPPTFQNQSGNSRVATIGSLKRSEPSSDEEEGQAFYAGGSQSGGGQQILGPKKKNPDALVSEMFKNAKEHGAEVVDPSQRDSKKKSTFFQGAAYRLGTENEPEPPAAMSLGLPPVVAPPSVDVVLRFWRNGFSVNDGPLRDFHDPSNMEFLQDIKSGKIPRELVQLAKGRMVTLDMEDHSHEDYSKPKVTLQAFSGQGHRLGNPTDSISPSLSGISMGTCVDHKPLEDSAVGGPSVATTTVVDESLPITNIQIRLPDGSRLVSKFNQTHTVADVRQYIVKNRPVYSQSTFVLMTTFPNKEITDETLTLKDANLINTVLVVRIK